MEQLNWLVYEYIIFVTKEGYSNDYTFFFLCSL